MDQLTGAGSALATVMFVWAIFSRYFDFDFSRHFIKQSHRLIAVFYPYLQISFAETSSGHWKRSEAYNLIEAYLSTSSSQSANKLMAELGKDNSSLTLSMDEYEEVVDEFEGAKIWWSSFKIPRKSHSLPWYPAEDDKKFYKVTFHRSHRELIINNYLPNVMGRGREIRTSNKQRKLYTNNPSSQWSGYKSKVWSHVLFEHPSTFDTLAMDPAKKQEVITDLIAFKSRKDYYLKIGKAWKRGYLLYGPPGTGKSTMIAAIANFLDYDIYDLELTSVRSNTELRKLFIETTSKSIIVIEDIDCSLDLTGKRTKKSKEEEENSEEKMKPPAAKEEKEENKVTLSGLLNFIDGLWSACGGERLVIFTTNYIEKLDPALIRRGRMDKHIEMSFCSFEAFKVLAKNYLDIDSHPLFETIHRKLEEVKIIPADVAEHLMPKTLEDGADSCLQSMIEALEAAKEKAAEVTKDNTQEIVEEKGGV